MTIQVSEILTDLNYHKMIYCFPVSLSDAHLIDPLCDVIGHLGGMKGRRVVIVSDPQASAHAGRLHERMVQLDAKSQIHTFPMNLTQGWPVACNHYFAMTVGYLTNKLGITDPFFYFELDNTPIKEGWIERIGSEWGSAVSIGKRFMGVMREYMAETPNGLSSQGNILNGSCVYPPEFGRMSPLLRSLTKSNLPWDVFMRWELCGRPSNPNVHEISKYIVFNWGTENYRWEGNQIKCDVKPRPTGILTSDKTYPITADTILVHGCKDGSLARLIMAQDPQKAIVGLPAQEEKPKAPTRHNILPTAAAPAEEVRSIIADLLKADGKLPEGVVMPTVPAIVEQAKPVPASYKKRSTKAKKTREKKKRNISPEESQRRSERIKAMLAEKRAQLQAA